MNTYIVCVDCAKIMDPEIDFVYDGKGYQRKCCKECYQESERIRASKRRSPEQQKISTLKFRFNLTPKEYEEMLLIQNGVCAVCKMKCITGQSLSIDHDHKTNKVRGLLCRKCNSALGLLQDDELLVYALFEYITKNRSFS